MTVRVVLTMLLAAGCAAAVPAVHETFGGSRSVAMHGASLHHGSADGPAGREQIRGCVDRALDSLDLDAERRSKAKAILETHFDEALALHEKIRTGEIGHDAAMAEHERILASAKEELAPLLTPDEIRRLHDALHPRVGSAAPK
jgi:hypothetical protein